jgi:hypothetical protein
MRRLGSAAAAVGTGMALLILAMILLVGPRPAATPVPSDNATEPLASSPVVPATAHEPVPDVHATPTAAPGQPTPAFPTMADLPPRGVVIEVPVEIELAPIAGGD